MNAVNTFREETQEGARYEIWWYSTEMGVIDLKKKSI